MRFHLDRPYVDFPYTVSDDNYNSIILPKGYKLHSFSKGGIGTGPFILKSLSPKQSATFVRNPHYWMPGLPYLAGVTVRYFNDPQSTVLALQSGAIDIYPQMAYATARGLFNDSNVRVLQLPSSEHRTVAMRTDQAPFNDVRVRQALAYSVDRDAIVRGLFGGHAELGNDDTFAHVYKFCPARRSCRSESRTTRRPSVLSRRATRAGSRCRR